MAEPTAQFTVPADCREEVEELLNEAGVPVLEIVWSRKGRD